MGRKSGENSPQIQTVRPCLCASNGLLEQWLIKSAVVEPSHRSTKAVISRSRGFLKHPAIRHRSALVQIGITRGVMVPTTLCRIHMAGEDNEHRPNGILTMLARCGVWTWLAWVERSTYDIAYTPTAWRSGTRNYPRVALPIHGSCFQTMLRL